MKARIVSIGDNLPDGWVLLTLAVKIRPDTWAPHTVPVQVPSGMRLKQGDVLQVEYVDPADPSRGLLITTN